MLHLTLIFGIGDALASNVLERVKELGTLRALGLRPTRLAGMIFSQALAIGLVGAGLAVLLGFEMTYAFVRGIIPSAIGWDLPLHLSGGVAVVGALVGLASCLVGAMLPAIGAARLSVVQPLRHE